MCSWECSLDVVCGVWVCPLGMCLYVCVTMLLRCRRAIVEPLSRAELCGAASLARSFVSSSSPADWRPLPYLLCSLNCGTQCHDSVTYSNNRELNSAPPITPQASHTANGDTAWARLTNTHPSPNDIYIRDTYSPPITPPPSITHFPQ